MNARGAMYEINYLIWPVVYGVAAHAWGARAGHPLVLTVAGVVVGIVTSVPLARAAFYDVELAGAVGLPAALLVPAPWRPWYLTALCAAPWLRLALRRRPAPPT